MAVFEVGDAVDFAHLNGEHPGSVDEIFPDGHVFVTWPDGSCSVYDPCRLKHAVRGDVLPEDSLEEVRAVFMHGATRYGMDNWAKANNKSGDHVAKALGHIARHLNGERRETGENGSGYRHLSHAAARLLMAIGKELRNP